MKHLLFGVGILMLLIPPAWAGYREMKAEIEAYAPPSGLSTPALPPAPEASEPAGPDAALGEESPGPEQMKAQWERSLASPEVENTFVRPDPAMLKKHGPAAAIQALRNAFSAETLETLALLRNPGVKAAQSRIRAELESFSQVAALDAVLQQYTAFTEGLMNGVGPMRGKNSVAMKFPFPGITALKGQVVAQSVRAAREDVEIARREAMTDARKTYWNLLYLRDACQVTSETLDLFQDLETVADTRYKSVATSFQDVIRVSIRKKILGENLITLRENQKNMRAKLRAILDLRPGAAVGDPEARVPDRTLPALKALYIEAKARRQELRKMRAMVGKTERMAEMAETMILPPFTLSFSVYEDAAVIQAGSGAMKPSFPVSTPASTGAGLPRKPWFGTSDAWLRQLRQSLEALMYDLKRAEAATEERVRNAWFALDRAVREAVLYQNSILDLPKSALDVSTRGYESGSVSFADVIGSYTDWLNARLALARKNSDIGIARAELAKAVGVSF
ncbi:TolC family protein [Desulfonema ishimotonii]|uniref:TolC family protein n=1 Tax=Desulfonema ishimotonii TaxID=45657 RepID=A0A401FVR1_9BACT|nr:TolC family protein [Desulfonema ishimotonii]GBC61050.1 TolC family protein [Desulfonema ishimotonii]